MTRRISFPAREAGRRTGPFDSASRLAAATALALMIWASPGPAAAREVTITAKAIDRFVGGVYAVFYITDADRKDYQATVWVAGDRPRFVSEARHWWRATDHIDDRHAEYDGRSGASMWRRETLTIRADIADELFDAGYVLRVDTTLWGGRTNGSEVVVPLDTGQSGQKVEGRGYLDHVKIDF